MMMMGLKILREKSKSSHDSHDKQLHVHTEYFSSSIIVITIIIM